MSQTFITTFANALYRASLGKSKTEIDAVAKRGVEVLAAKRMLRNRSAVFAALEAVRLADEKKMKAVVTSKYPLPPSDLRAIAEHMKQIMKKDIELEAFVDPNLLGGFKVRCGDTVFDATLDQSLRQLAQHLTTKE